MSPLPTLLWPSQASRKVLIVTTALCSLIFLFQATDIYNGGSAAWKFDPQSPQKGFYFPAIQYNASAFSIEDLNPSRLHSGANATHNLTSSDTIPDPFAYVFYATDDDYACSVLVNINRIRNIFKSTHQTIVLVKPYSVSDSIHTAIEDYDASVLPYEPPPIKLDYAYYANVLLKLVSFRLHQYVPSLQRIIVMDSDQLVLRDLDHLFHLPDAEVAAPRMYWGGGWSGLTSALMVIQPSDYTWELVKAVIDEPKVNVWFDMDMVNQLFGNTSLILPGTYCTLNAHFQGIDIPGWYRGRVPERDEEWEPKTVMTADVKTELAAIEARKAKKGENGGAEEDGKGDHVDSAALREYKQAVEEEELLERKARLSDLLTEVFEEEAMVVHFSNMGKPWQNTGASLRSDRPHAHPLLAETMETWRREARDVCPDLEDIEI